MAPDVPVLPLVPVAEPVPAPEPMPVLPAPVLPEPMLELPGVVVLGLVLDPELEVPLALSRRHWSFCVPVSRSQFWVLVLLLEELLGEVVDEEVLGEVLEPVLLPVLEGVPTPVPIVLLEPLLLGVALVLPEPTLEPDEPMLPLLDDCANEVAEIANSAAVTAALSTFTIMVLLLRRLKNHCSGSRASAVPRRAAARR